MGPVADWLGNIFLFTFLFGLVFTVVSLFLGAGHMGGLDAGHDGGLDLGHDTGVDVGHADAGGPGGPSVLNLPTIMAFLTWFGGAGYIFTRTLGVGALLSVPMAVISGIAGGAIMFALLTRLLWPMMSKPMSRAEYSLPGTPARVVSSIRAEGVGEIVYMKAGSRFTAGAKAADGQPVPKGAEVVIIKYERGLAYVQPVESLLNSERDEPSAETDLAKPEAVTPERL